MTQRRVINLECKNQDWYCSAAGCDVWKEVRARQKTFLKQRFMCLKIKFSTAQIILYGKLKHRECGLQTESSECVCVTIKRIHSAEGSGRKWSPATAAKWLHRKWCNAQFRALRPQLHCPPCFGTLAHAKRYLHIHVHTPTDTHTHTHSRLH